MTTNAISGVGTVFNRQDDPDSSGAAFSAIAEINNISGPNMSRETIDVTSIDSDGGYREFIASFRDGGEVVLGMNFTRDGYISMKTDFEDSSAHAYQIVMPDTGNTTFDFDALVVNLGSAVPTDDKITMDVTLKISGQVTVSS